MEKEIKPATNSRFAKAGVSCFYDREVLNSNFVHIMKFSAKNPRLRKAAKRYVRLLLDLCMNRDQVRWPVQAARVRSTLG
jgi:hypothetical protein